MKYKYLSFISVIVLGLSASQARAGIRPSFSLETCSWNATDIVIATEGKKIDGLFRVLETLKGDLNPGDTINIPPLASFAAEASRTVADPWYEKEKKSHVIVTGERMILFLKKDPSQLPGENGLRPSAESIRWTSANYYREMTVSVVWLEQEKAFGFVQVMNPGPSVLISLSSEEELRNGVLEVLDIQKSFLQAVSIADPAKRAEAFEPFVHHSLYQARDEADNQLKKCGKAALPVLRRMLSDDALLDVHSSLVEILSQVGTSEARADFAGLIAKDVEFWRWTGPVLKKGWWNGEGFDSLTEVEPLRNRYSRDYGALLGLQRRPYRASEGPVTELRALWRSLPQLADMGQISEACDAVLKEIDRIKVNVNAIHFEGSRDLGESEVLETLHSKGVVPDERAPFTAEIVEQVKLLVQQRLAARGYRHPTIESDIDPEGRTLTFVIDEGNRAAVAQVRFQGQKGMTTEQLNAPLKQCLDRFHYDDYAQPMYESCMEKVEGFVRDRGYLQAHLRGPEPNETERGLVVSIHVDEGRLFRLGQLKVEGSRLISPAEIKTLIGLKEGDVANGEQLHRVLFEDLKKRYDSQGFIEYKAEVSSAFQENPGVPSEGIVDLSVIIAEGRAFRLRSVTFAETKVPRKQLLGFLLIHEGEIFSNELMQKSIDRLKAALRFQPGDDVFVDAKTDQALGVVDVVIILRRLWPERDSDPAPKPLPNGPPQ